MLEFDDGDESKTALTEIPFHDSDLDEMRVLLRQIGSLQVAISSWIHPAKTNTMRIAADLPFLARKPFDQGMNLDEDELP